MMINRYYRTLVFVLLATLVGCSSLPFGLGDDVQVATSTLDTSIVSTAISTQDAIEVPPLARTSEPLDAPSPAGGQFVRIWLPPQFDLEGSNIGSTQLKARLERFTVEHPGIQLEVRVKALEGPGGLLDALVAANAAAPSALPDLVLMPRPILESAALKGLLYPLDGLTSIMDDQTWFEYAQQLSHLKANTYGIPFAGNIMVLAHSSSSIETAPASLADVLSINKTLLFPAGDPQGLFTLCMYLAEGGMLQDDQGRPALDEAVLENILDYYQEANLAEVMPYTLTQYSDDAQVWEALLGNQSPMAVTWATTYLNDTRTEPAGLLMAPLPTPDGSPFALASGWSWVLTGQDQARRTLSVELAEYLVDKEFLAGWSRAAGYLPPRIDALQMWPATQSRQVIEQISYSAWLVPSADLVSIIGPALQTAVLDMLRGGSDARTAARAAINRINQP